MGSVLNTSNRMATQSAKLRSESYRHNNRRPSQAWILRVIIFGFLLLTLAGWIVAQDTETENFAGYRTVDRTNIYIHDDEADRAADDDDAAGGGEGEGGGGGGGGGGEGGGGGGGEGGGGGGGEGGGGEGGGGGGDAATGGGDAAAGGGDAAAGGGDAGVNKDDVGTDWRYGFEGLGTTHEQMGQNHWPAIDYTEFESKVEYRGPEDYSKMGLGSVFNFTHYLFQMTMTDEPPLPDGYLIVKSMDTMILGPKTEMNEWRDLLWMYWLHLLFVSLLVFLILIVPFLAVCYCCFCCCRRCPRGCRPCTGARDARCRLLCGLLLLLLTLLLLLGTLITLFSNILIDKGFGESRELMKRSSDDTCRFLNDISAHINHLLGNNFEETVNHLTDMVNGAPNHIFLDLSDSSEANAVEEMERIFDNMPKALKLLSEVNAIEKEMRFLTCQLKDGVRGVKREATQACLLSDNLRCNRFLRYSSIEYIDTTNCLHLDQLPDSNLYVMGAKQAIDAKLTLVAKNALLRLQNVKNAIAKQLEKVGPPLISSLNKGRDMFLYEANKIQNIINRIVSDIHFNTLRASKSFEGLYEKFAIDRSRINLAVCILLILIVILLIIALILGCCLSKRSASIVLFCVMILIFCVFSFFLLVGLFYFMLGMVAYHGACKPVTGTLHMDTAVDMSRLVPNDIDFLGGPQPVQSSKALKGCQIHQTIFNVLSESNQYDITDLTRLSILEDPEDAEIVLEEDFSKVELFTLQEKKLLIDHISGNLSSYHSVLYVQNLCKTLTPHTLTSVANELRDICKELYSGFYGGHYFIRVALTNCALSLEAYNKEWTSKIQGMQDSIKIKLRKIDELILYNNNNFGETLHVLLATIMRSEAFIQSRGKKYISELTKNLTIYCSEQIDQYISMVISKCSTEVGECRPLAYTYYRGVEMICYHLVDPINAFWVGLFMCSLLFIPLLFVLHRLMCLYKVCEHSPRHNRGAVGVAGVRHSTPPCPICTGAPYTLPPIVTCGGGQQASCPCPGGGENRAPGGMSIISLPEDMPNESYGESDTVTFQCSKRKND